LSANLSFPPSLPPTRELFADELASFVPSFFLQVFFVPFFQLSSFCYVCTWSHTTHLPPLVPFGWLRVPEPPSPREQDPYPYHTLTIMDHSMDHSMDPERATSLSTPRKFSIRSNFGKARQPRSRKNRPCDACRRRKTACVITSEPPCETRPISIQSPLYHCRCHCLIPIVSLPYYRFYPSLTLNASTKPYFPSLYCDSIQLTSVSTVTQACFVKAEA
jgi:hypothetical protein